MILDFLYLLSAESSSTLLASPDSLTPIPSCYSMPGIGPRYLVSDALELRAEVLERVLVLVGDGDGDVVHDQVNILDVFKLGLKRKNGSKTLN